MGLFNGAKKREALENEIMQALSQLPILDDLVNSILNSELEWLRKCQGYYDNRNRDVLIKTDIFEVKWANVGYENGKRLEEVMGKADYYYTDHGYRPLHCHEDENGYEDVSVERVLYLWASIVRERLMAKMPECNFGDVYENGDYSVFSYEVPALVWKSWF